MLKASKRNLLVGVGEGTCVVAILVVNAEVIRTKLVEQSKKYLICCK